MEKDTKPQPTYFHPKHPVLEDDVEEAAVNGQLIKYPSIVRGMTDPVLKVPQAYTNISFMLFKEPRNLSTGKHVYGFVKARGAWPDHEVATREASKIIKKFDSKYKILVAPTGKWLPITDEESFCSNNINVDLNPSNPINVDNELEKEIKERRKQEESIKKELEERTLQLQSEDDDVYDDPFSLDYYTNKRSTEMKLTESINKYKKILEDLYKTRHNTFAQLRKLEKVNPNYKDEWLDNYDIPRKAIKLPRFIPSKEQFKDYENAKISDQEIEDCVLEKSINNKKKESK
jgi:hypothetical protein